jgi:hypothetical protein
MLERATEEIFEMTAVNSLGYRLTSQTTIFVMLRGVGQGQV